MPAVIFSGTKVKTLKDTLTLNDTVEVLQGTDDPTSVAKDAVQGSIYLRTGASGGQLFTKQDAGSSTNWTNVAASSTTETPMLLENVGIEATVAASALTVSLKQSDGSTDPSGGSPVKVAFRSDTLTNGGFNVVTITGTASTTIASGGTLGHVSGEDEFIYVYLVNDGGTIRIGISSTGDHDELSKVTTVVANSASDAREPIYTGAAATNAEIRLIGRLVSNQATAGTWNSAPTEQASGLGANPGRLTRNSEVLFHDDAGAGSTNTNVRNFNNQVDTGDSSIMTGALSGTLGASVTLHRYGKYSAHFSGAYSTARNIMITRNSTSGAAVFPTVLGVDANPANQFGESSATFIGEPGDVIRPVLDGASATSVATTLNGFRINFLGN